jgi:hypothetical protein
MNRRGTPIAFSILFLLYFLLSLASCSIGPKSPSPTRPPQAAPTAIPISTLNSSQLAQVQINLLNQSSPHFAPPKEMQVGVAERVTYRVSYGVNVLPNAMVNRVPSSLKATLIGEGDTFAIELLSSSDEKMLLPSVPFEWSWRVTPTRSGSHNLTIRVTAIIAVGQEKVPYDVLIDEKTVAVQANWAIFVSDIFKQPWVLLMATTVLLAVAALIYQLRKSLRQSPPIMSSASTRAHLESLRATIIRRVQHLEEQQARMGNNTPPEILIEIEDLRQKVAELDRQLAH